MGCKNFESVTVNNPLPFVKRKLFGTAPRPARAYESRTRSRKNWNQIKSIPRQE